MNYKFNQLLNENKHNFTQSDTLITKFIIEKTDKFLSNTILETANELYISKSSLTRYSKKLGLPGYKELKFLIADTTTYEEKVKTTKTSNNLIDHFLNDYQFILEQFKTNVNEKLVKKISSNIIECKNIYILGIGSSGFLAQDFSMRLFRMGINSRAITEHDQIKMVTQLATKNDFFIYISLFGETSVITESIQMLNNFENIENVLLTENLNSTSAKICENILLSPQKNNLALTDSISNQFGLMLLSDLIIHTTFMSNEAKFKINYAKSIIK